MKNYRFKQLLFLITKMNIIPLLFYFIIFCIFTYPLISHFSTHFFVHPYFDGLQNIWNIWWFNKSITQLHQFPCSTNYLHYPFGISLIGHTLNISNGFLGVILLKFFTLTETYNFIAILSFIASGLMAFFLAYHFTKTYWSSILAGFIFTFSNFHFIHAVVGHLKIAMELIPLFVLSFFVFLSKPNVFKAIISALLFSLAILCDYYYSFYCILLGCLLFLWHWIHKKNLFFFKKEYLLPLITFVFVVLLASGPMVISLISSNQKDPFLGYHKPEIFSIDLFSPIIYGAYWRFSHLTAYYWSNLHCYFGECSVHLGVSVILVLLYTWIRRKKIQVKTLNFWYFILVFFYLMSLGPVLHIWGRAVQFLPMPYKLLEWIFPFLKLSGVPARMMVMVVFSSSVIFAIGFRSFIGELKKNKIFMAVFFIMFFLEYLPQPMPFVKIDIPEYVKILKSRPANKGVLDIANNYSLQLYYQTIYDKPMAFGYVARLPKSLKEKEDFLAKVITNKDYKKLYYDYDIGYLIVPANFKVVDKNLLIKILYCDNHIALYELGTKDRRLR